MLVEMSIKNLERETRSWPEMRNLLRATSAADGLCLCEARGSPIPRTPRPGWRDVLEEQQLGCISLVLPAEPFVSGMLEAKLAAKEK